MSDPKRASTEPKTSTVKRSSTILVRLTAAVREQNWFAVVLEVLIVVLGVVIGFQVTAWGNHRSELIEEQELLAGLRGEFTSVMVDLRLQVEKHKRVENAVAATLETLGAAKNNGVASVAVADTTLAWSYVPTTTQFTQGILKGMLTTGRLTLIRDQELRTSLAEWEGVLADVTEDEVASREIVMYQYAPIFFSKIDVRPIRTYDLLLGTLSASEMEATTMVPVDLEMLGILSTRLFWLKHTIQEFSGLQTEALRILDLLEQAIEESK